MNSLLSSLYSLLAVLCLACVLAVPSALAAGDDWRPVDPAELALKAPVVEKEADAEALFWEIRVDDGEVGELKKDDVFERDVIKASGLRVKAKSFAMPSVEPGSIIEYRWREVRSNQWANYVRLQFQRDIPVQSVKYYIKPYPFPNMEMRAYVFHGQLPPFTKEKNGFYSATMTAVPAYHEDRLAGQRRHFQSRRDRAHGDGHGLHLGAA